MLREGVAKNWATSRGGRLLGSALGLALVIACAGCHNEPAPPVEDGTSSNRAAERTAVSCSAGQDDPASANALVARLGDESTPREKRIAIADSLMSSVDHATIDALVGGFDDSRVFDPEGDNCQRSVPFESETCPITVAQECNLLVSRMLVPRTLAMGRIPDLRQWWQAHRHLPMGEILRIAREIDDRPPRGPQR